MSAYADTSFIFSLYVSDSNSTEAAKRIERLPLPVSITPLGELELVNALQLRVFRKELLPAEIHAAHAAFRADLGNGVLLMRPLMETIYGEASRIATKWVARLGTRTLDIIHVACALAMEAETFSTFDERQAKLARAVGLRTL